MNYLETPANVIWNTDDIQTHGEVTSWGVADSAVIGTEMMPKIGYFHSGCCCCCYHVSPVKSAREQVIDEILTKMAEAVSKDDFKQAKKFAQLAKAIKEL